MKTETATLGNIIAESLQKAVDYKQYRELTDKLAEKGMCSGDVQDEERIGYTALNCQRMNRLDKTIKIDDSTAKSIAAFDEKTVWLVISESWCGDAAQILPVINKVALLNENITLKIVLRDENLALMQQFLTNGAMSIPKMIVLNQDNEVLSVWGPRPEAANRLVTDYREKHGAITDEIKQEIQLWYNKDKGRSTADELANLLMSIAPEKCR